MKYLIITSVFIGLWADFNKITNSNDLNNEAEKAFQLKDYTKAAHIYQSLLNEYVSQNETIRLNLANSLYLGGKRKEAAAEYEILTRSPDPATRSNAFQQLGLILALKGKYEAALSDFLQALKTEPGNEKARHNYELIKKIHEQELSLDQSADKKDPSGNETTEGKKGTQKKTETMIKELRADGKRKEDLTKTDQGDPLLQQSTSGRRKEKSQEATPESNAEGKELNRDKKGNKEQEALKAKRLNEIRISEEKARMILEVMKNEEIQYIQQRRRNESNKEYKNKPDW